MTSTRKTATRPQKVAPHPQPAAADVVLTPRPEAKDGELITEGDYAGMTYDEVLRASVESVHEALGELSVMGAMATLDMAIAEALAIVEHTEGAVAAKDAGIKICQTALPYAMLDVSDEPDRRKSLAEARRELKRG